MSFVAGIQANIDDFQRNLDRAQAHLDAFSQSVGQQVAKIGGKLQAIGGALSIGVTAPMIAAGTAAYNMAADFEDALGAVDQIFKGASESTKDWANTLPTYFGIAKKEALEYSNMMGSMLQNIGGLTEKEASKQSAKLIELAGDLTAMYGGSTQEAVRALTGSLKGNNTMLDNYGMAASDALVKAKALSMGLVAQGKEMSLSAKQAATLALIYEQSGAAQGQAAREANGASGSMRAFRTEITNLTTELGSHLLPLVTPLTTFLKDAIAGFRGLSPEAQKMIVYVGGAVAALGPFLVALGSIMKLAPLVGTAFATMTGPVGIAVMALSAAAILIIKNWDKIKEYFTNGPGAKLWESISNGAQILWGKLKTIFETVKTFLISTWDKIGSNVKSIVGNTFDTILVIVDTTIKHITGVIELFAALLRGDFSGTLKSVQSLFSNIFQGISKIAANTLSSLGNQIAGFLKLIGADGLGNTLESWSNKLKPVNVEVKTLEETTDKVVKKTNEQTVSTQTLGGAIESTKKKAQDYRRELTESLGQMGYYDSALGAIVYKYNDLTKLAKQAGASATELGRIAREELGEKLSLALGQSKLSETKPKLKFDLIPNVNIEEISRQMDASTASIIPKMTVFANELTEGFNNVINQGIQNGLINLASAIGGAIGEGGNILSAAGNSLLSSLGSILVELGKMAITTGIGIEAIQTALKTLNPYVAVAAGAALIALGSAVSSSVKGLGSKAGGSYTGGYSSGSAGAMKSSSTNIYGSSKPQRIEITGRLVADGRDLKTVFDRQNSTNKRTN